MTTIEPYKGSKYSLSPSRNLTESQLAKILRKPMRNTTDASYGWVQALKKEAAEKKAKTQRVNRNTGGGGGYTGGQDAFSAITGQGGAESRLSSVTSEFKGLSDEAERLTGPAEHAQLAGQAIEDVDRQFAGQQKAGQLRMSRMGLDPSQNASVTGGRQERIAQAVARAGAMQGARRQAEVNQQQAKQSTLQTLGSMASEQRQFAQAEKMQRLQGSQDMQQANMRNTRTLSRYQ